MGCKITCFKSAISPISINQRIIEEQLEMDAVNEASTVKLLLLGTSGSGKSTLAKQIRLIHKEGFTDEERQLYTTLIHSNTARAIIELLEAVDCLGIHITSKLSQKDKMLVQLEGSTVQRGEGVLKQELGYAIQRLWRHSDVKRCYNIHHTFQLIDSTEYYLDDVERISSSGYVPTDQDIIRSRVVTTGVIETTFRHGAYQFRMFDVGGQRSERRKWIHLFDNVTAILFTVGMSDYDLVLPEDNTNSLRESNILFKSIVDNSLFKKTAIILFLNKMDIFEKKLLTSSLVDHFPTYNGTSNLREATGYIREMFLRGNRLEREIFCHCTIATDLNSIELVFKSSMNVILTDNIKTLGLV